MGSLTKSIHYQDIVDHLFSAQRYWYAALPGIYDELAEGIIEAKKKNPNLDIELVIDPTETAFRSHHGSINAIHLLQYCEINIKQIPNHRLGFFLSENSGYYLFTQSRAIEKEPTGVNAILMNELSKQEILVNFFQKEAEPDMIFTHKFVTNYVTNNDGNPQPLVEEDFEGVSEEIEQNPPPSPDFKRVYDVYSTKIKFIEFEVKGIKVQNRMVPIPNDVINLIDENLRDQISTRLNIFDDETKQKLEQKLAGISKEVENIREEFLKRVTSRKKSVLHTKHLGAFNERVLVLQQKYNEIQQQVESDIYSSLINLRERLKKELLTIYKQKTPEELMRFQQNPQYSIILDDFASRKATKINLPTRESIMKGFEIVKRIFDPTYEDFKDESFIDELEEIGFITKAERIEIVEEFLAIGTQKDESE